MEKSEEEIEKGDHGEMQKLKRIKKKAVRNWGKTREMKRTKGKMTVKI